MRIEITSPYSNFLLRPVDEGFTSHSDMVAKAEVGGKQYRIVHIAGSCALKKAKRGQARADMFLPAIRALPISKRDADALYLDLLKQDKARRIRLTKVLLALSRPFR